jgi:hypothetical protein
MAVTKKQIFIDVYNPLTGVKITTWVNANINQFTKNINGGLSEAIIDLPYTFDYSGSDIAEGNDVKISITDKDTTPGVPRIIYTGYISMIEGNISDGQESMTVHLLGYNTSLATDILQTAMVTTKTYTTTDIGAIIRDLVATFKTANPTSKINYTTTTIPDVGQTITYTFKRVTYQDAIDRLRSIAPANYYFYIDENSTVNFKPKPTTPTHTFILGRHFSAVSAQRGVEKVRNSLLLWNGQVGTPGVDPCVYKRYEDSNSIGLYGRRTKVIDDYGITTGAVADLLAANFLAENTFPEIVLTIEIFDNTEDPDGKGYDIESIQPGDTCSFIGFSEGFSARYLSANMLITSVNYTPEKVELTIDPRNLGMIDWQDQNAKNIDQSVADGTPTTYTV